MAKRKHHRRYRGLMPVSFGKLIPDLNRSANGKDVVFGAAAGALGALVIRYAWNKWLPAAQKAKSVPVVDATTGKTTKSAWVYVDEYLPVIGAAAAGAGVFFFSKKKNPGKAFGMALGAGAVAAGIAGLWLGQDLVPAFNGLVALNGLRGVIVPDRSKHALRGIVMSSPASQVLPEARWRTGHVQAAAYRALSARR